MKRYLALLAVLIPMAVLAATANFSWINSAVNDDGTAIPASGPGALTETYIEYGPCNAAGTALASVSGSISAPVPGPSTASRDFPPGLWCAHARHANTYGEVSEWTDVVSFTKANPKPGKPTNFTFGS